MRQFLRRALNLDLVDGLLILTAQQQQLMARMDLQSARNCRDLLEHFLVDLEKEVDRDELIAELTAGVSDLSDHVARLEEHVS